ncbi:MAG: hypothetical protein Q8P01_05635 [bacterium]|nr:hypothetical protein [bacterium]
MARTMSPEEIDEKLGITKVSFAGCYPRWRYCLGPSERERQKIKRTVDRWLQKVERRE